MSIIGRRPYEVTLGGISYRVHADGYRRLTVPPLRPQVDQGESVGEGSVAQTGLIRSVQRDFSGGAGQAEMDRPDSVPNRYWYSHGVNPFTPGRLGQFQAVGVHASVASTPMGAHSSLFYVAGRLFWVLYDKLHYTGTDLLAVSLTPVTLTGAVQASTSTGNRVYVAYAGGGMGYVDTASFVKTDFGGGTAAGGNTWAFIDYTGGRLFGGTTGGLLCELDSAGAKTDIYTHPFGAQFSWRGVSAGPDGYYAYGTGPAGGEVYRFAVDPASGALVKPRIAATLHGESPLCMAWVSDFAFIGSNLGFRVAQRSGDGQLAYGPLVRREGAVASGGLPLVGVHRCAVAGRYVLIPWGDAYDGSAMTSRYYAVGRVDMATFTRPLVPAYCCAEGYKNAGGAHITNYAPDGVVNVNGWPYFTTGNYMAGEYTYPAGGSGGRVPAPAAGNITHYLYGPDNARTLMDGRLVTSRRSFGLADLKTLTHVAVGTEPMSAGELRVDVRTDDNTDVLVGYISGAGSRGTSGPALLPVAARQTGSTHQVILTFANSVTAVHSGPVVRSVASLAAPAIPRVEQIDLPIAAGIVVDSRDGYGSNATARAVFGRFKALEASGELVAYQEGGAPEMLVRVDGVRLDRVEFEDASDWWKGVVTVTLLTVEQTGSLSGFDVMFSQPLAGSAASPAPPPPSGGVS